MASAAKVESHAVFLSYNHADTATVTRISSALERQVSVFIDSKSLAKGMPWGPALAAALERATAVVVFFGPAGVGGWQEREIYFALDRQVEAKQAGVDIPVIPVLLPQADSAAVPGFLKQNTWIEWPSGDDASQAVAALVEAVEGRGVPASPRALDICPYRGLASFHPEDAGFFFGRTKLVDLLEAKVRQKNVVAVIGASGSGKSSVVRAGLIPRLLGTRPPEPVWDVAVCTPGGYPWRSVADALAPIMGDDANPGAVADDLEAGKGALESAVKRVLARKGGGDRLLLVVDQMEELFTLGWSGTSAPAERAAATRKFVAELLETAGLAPLHVVFTLRADFYGQAIQTSRALSDAWSADGQVNVGPMTADELTEAIEGPARLVGLEFDPGLVDTIKADVEAQPGSLPLVEYALTNLWRDAHDRGSARVTLDAYGRVGKVAGSIARRAEDVYGGLPAERQKLTRSLMLRLVRASRADEEGSDTRRRATRSEVGEDAWTIAQAFASPDNRLLVIAAAPGTSETGGTVEVAHEALIANWKRLREWIDEERTFLLWRQRLATYIEAWRETRSTDLLLPRDLLKEARPYLKANAQDLSTDEKRYLRASFRRSARGKFITALAAVVMTVAIGVSAAVLLYARTVDWQIRQITWNAPSIAEQAFDGEERADYEYALGLAGRTVFPSRATRHYQDWASWLEGTVENWNERFGLEGSVLRSAALVRGLAAAGYPELVQRVIDVPHDPATPRLWAVAAIEAARAGRVSEAKAYRAKGLAKFGADRSSESILPLAYACRVTGDEATGRQLLLQLDTFVSNAGQAGGIPSSWRDSLPFAVPLGRLDSILGAMPKTQADSERAFAVNSALLSGLVEDDREVYRLLGTIGNSYQRDTAATALLVRTTSVAMLEQITELLPDYSRNAALSAAFAAQMSRGEIEAAVFTAGLLAKQNATPSQPDLNALLSALERMGRNDDARRLLEATSSNPYAFGPHIVLLAADLLRHKGPDAATAFANRFNRAMDPNAVMATAWICLGHPEKVSLEASQSGKGLSEPPPTLALQVKIAAGQVRDLDAARTALKDAGLQSKWSIGTELVSGLIMEGRVADARSVAAMTAPASSPDESLRQVLVQGGPRASLLSSSDSSWGELLTMVRNLEGAGESKAVEALLAGAYNSALRTLSDGGKMVAGLAWANAKLGRFRDALDLAEQCPTPKLRLFAYTAILAEYAVHRKPELRTFLERRDFPGHPGFLRY